MKKNVITHQKLSHGDVLVWTDEPFNYLEQEIESIRAEKMMLRNL